MSMFTIIIRIYSRPTKKFCTVFCFDFILLVFNSHGVIEIIKCFIYYKQDFLCIKIFATIKISCNIHNCSMFWIDCFYFLFIQ